MRLLRKYSIRYFIGLVGLLLCAGGARAQSPGGQVKALAVLDGSLHQILVDSTSTVEDSTFFDPANAGKLDSSYAVQDQVTLMINEASTLYFRTPFSVTVKLQITYTNAQGVTIDTVRNFTVNYDTSRATTYNSRSTFVFSGAHKVTITVLSDSSNVATWDPTSVLLIENQLTTTPVFVFNCSNTVSNITVNPSTNPNADELPVSWNVVHGANQYDLEWEWVDSSALADTTRGYWRYGAPPNYNPALIFHNGATRVTTTGTSYNIPIIYDNTGALFIRVRPVQVGSNYAVTNAIWSSDASPAVMGQFTFRGHERPLNWQSNISFAEEGKRKVVVQYYDGSLRSRQTVTKDNTTNTTIVGETYYDYQGRPAIQVMPAPTLKTVIQYTAGFSVSYNSLESSLGGGQPQYSQSDFDTLPPLANCCNVRADSMVSDSGASLYYSPKNPVRTVGLNQFIPDAHDYPFTETEYMPDNTGRIKRQGGVGLYHQLSSGHETKYFYGTPSQPELDALFGTEVGDKSHYFKNMVRDANGQYSVSYVDMHGRTIATALAGLPPAGMGALPSYSRKTITENLLDSGTNYIDGQSMVSQKSLVVPMKDTFYFNYKFLPDVYNAANCQQQNVCYTCRYDLDITITDNCNNQTWGGQPYKVSRQNFSLSSLRNSCVDTATNISFSLALPEGSYMITKKLTVDPDVYAFYRDSIYLPNNTCTTISQFISQQTAIAEAANPSCTISCSQCQNAVGTWSSFWANYIQQANIHLADTAEFRTAAMTAYQNALSACSALCQTNTDTADIRSAMLQDMSPPYGQYADTLTAANGDPFSIFYIPPSDSLDYIPLYKQDYIVYLDENGNPDSVLNENSGLMVTPNTLTPMQFAQNFRPSWAAALLPYHPEYCRYLQLTANNSSLLYDRQMEAVNDFNDAVSLGFINPTNDPSFPIANTSNIDPYASEEGSALNSKLNSFKNLQSNNINLSMWGLACVMVKCDPNTSDVSCPMHYSTIANTFQSSDMCPGDLDMAWRYFREMYLGAKHDIFNQYQLTNPPNCTPNNPAYNQVPSVNTLVNKWHHVPIFNDANTSLSQNGLHNSVSGTTDANNQYSAAEDSLQSSYKRNCASYAAQWMQELSSCTLYSTTDINNIIAGLTGLCIKACDSAHPFGASSLPAGQTYLFGGANCASFLDIVNAYNSQHGYHPVTSKDSLNCNSDVIVSPFPYGSQPIYTSKPVYTRPSDCECSMINSLYTDYTLSTYGDASFSAFLLRTQQISMADSDLTTLRNMCGSPLSQQSCRNISNPIYLPPAMQCNSGTTCARCQTIDSLYSLYMQTYPSDSPSITTNIDTLQAQKNILFQNFMNNRLGFNLQAYQYLQFMDTCAVHSADTTTTPAGSLPLTVASQFKSDLLNAYNNLDVAPNNSTYAVGAFGLAHRFSRITHMGSDGTILWHKSIDSLTGAGAINKIKATADNGFIAVGSLVPAGSTYGQFVMFRGDSAGNRLWQKAIAFDGAPAWYGTDVTQLHDGSFAMLVSSNGAGSQPLNLVAKVDQSGNILWAKGFYDSVNCASNAYHITEINDTLFLTGSQSTNPVYRTYNQLGLFFKMDEDNGAIYNPVFLSDNSVSDTVDRTVTLEGVYSTPTGYRISGSRSLTSEADVVVPQSGVADIKFNGNLISYRDFGFVGADSFNLYHTGIGTSDGGWLYGSSVNYTGNMSFTKFNPDWSTAWSTASSLPGTNYMNFVTQYSDGSYGGFGYNDSGYITLKVSSVGSTGCYTDTISPVNLTSLPQMVQVARPGLRDITLGWTFYPDTLVTTNYSSNTSYISCSGGTYYINYNGPLLCGKSAPMLAPTPVNSATACTDSTFFGVSNGTTLFNTYTDSLTGSFEQSYLSVCMQAYKHESFFVTHNQSEYHYTLYYYDQAGNLLKTVPPAGVAENTDTNWIKQVDTARKYGQVFVPNHTLVTNYRYNSLNQVATQHTPDASGSLFWYDRLGRLAISQNRKQQLNSQYSYTQYDTLGRIVQVGQLTSGVPINDTISRNDSTLQLWIANAMPSANQITVTSYDSSAYALQWLIGQRNMRNRVSWTGLFNTSADLANGGQNAAAATYYTYDILGNVDTLIQDFGGGVLHSDVANSMNTNHNRFKKISYNFDLVSGKVNQVNYQHGHADAFYHSYLYDAENRITNVQSSVDSVNWDNDAFYSYYAHGPLARTVLGQQQVQGINYAYTLQGWLKAINPNPDTLGSFTLRPDSSGNIVANSAYNLLLNYYDSDYSPISLGAAPDSGVRTAISGDYRPLYNGNISSMGARIRGLNSPLLYNYQYDQLNRLIGMDAWNRTGGNWSAITKVPDFQERVGYDPNGNILQYRRNGNSSISLGMDSLNYSYVPGTNMLDHITDSVTSACSGCGDITSQPAGNYQYDSIGELIADNASNITHIGWTVYGKIDTIVKTNDTTITFTYDPEGKRVSKSVTHAGNTITTWYVRDAQGNILSTYTYGDPTVNGKDLTQVELDVYGSSRLGIWKRAVDVSINSYNPLPGGGDSLTFTRGNKLFELTNHLGNVLSTVSDKRWGVSANDSTVIYYNPDVVSANDYYPFGMLEPGRQYAQSMLGSYRYGFNGKENDNEVEGVGNSIDYGMRVYDPRLGRFASVDPLEKKYPFYSPYQYAGNMPVWQRDIDGMEPGEAPPPEEPVEDDKERDDLLAKLRNALKSPTPEELDKEKDDFDKWKKDPKNSIRNFLNNYGRNAFNAAEQIFNPTQNENSDQDVTKAVGNFVFRQNSTQLQNSNAADQEALMDAALARVTPGTVTGKGKPIVGQWLKGTQGNAGYVPESVANQLRGQNFKSFDDFRAALWKAVGNTPELAKQFSSSNQSRMQGGLAPKALEEQANGGQTSYQIHHIQPIQRGGAVYDVDNLMIVTPTYHAEVLSPTYHY